MSLISYVISVFIQSLLVFINVYFNIVKILKKFNNPVGNGRTGDLYFAWMVFFEALAELSVGKRNKW